jgi:large subunit ribosomal protein L21
MYAIVEIGGKQFRAEKDKKLKVPLLQADAGKKVQFDRVLVLEDDKGNVSFGTPLLENNAVTAEVIEHGRDKKIIVFHKKRRKGYQKKNGHRQSYSIIQVKEIGTVKAAKVIPAKEEVAAVKTAAKTTVKKAVAEKETAKTITAPKSATARKKPGKEGVAAVAKKETKAVAPVKKPAAKSASKTKTASSAAKKVPAKKKSEDVGKYREK